MKIKEIKSVVSENPVEFDVSVNNLLEKGYTLVRRGPEQVGPSAWKLYAELVKLDEADMEDQEAEPITLQEAVAVLREICQDAGDCSEDGCLMFAWCQKNLPAEPPPANWDDPANLEQPE